MPEQHHCHCGRHRHCKIFRAKKLGLLGILLFGLHILWHVVELLILPAIIIAFSDGTAESSVATDHQGIYFVNEVMSTAKGASSGITATKALKQSLQFPQQLIER